MYDVTAIAWGPWQAAFVEPFDGDAHRVQIRAHERKEQPRPPMLAEIVVDDPTEAGLRGALWHYAREHSKGSLCAEANPRWVDRFVAEEFPVR